MSARRGPCFSDAVGHFNADDGWAMASHVALSALMALFPFLIFVAAFAGSIGEASLADRVAELVFTVWPVEVAPADRRRGPPRAGAHSRQPAHHLGGGRCLPCLQRRRGDPHRPQPRLSRRR
ncbi:MAG: hypothetical protein WDM84_09250 [Bauldia sp.]